MGAHNPTPKSYPFVCTHSAVLGTTDSAGTTTKHVRCLILIISLT